MMQSSNRQSQFRGSVGSFTEPEAIISDMRAAALDPTTEQVNGN
jgi:hypothetical protein